MNTSSGRCPLPAFPFAASRAMAHWIHAPISTSENRTEQEIGCFITAACVPTGDSWFALPAPPITDHLSHGPSRPRPSHLSTIVIFYSCGLPACRGIVRRSLRPPWRQGMSARILREVLSGHGGGRSESIAACHAAAPWHVPWSAASWRMAAHRHTRRAACAAAQPGEPQRLMAEREVGAARCPAGIGRTPATIPYMLHVQSCSIHRIPG